MTAQTGVLRLIALGPGLIESKHGGTVNRTSFMAANDLGPFLLVIAGIKCRRMFSLMGSCWRMF